MSAQDSRPLASTKSYLVDFHSEVCIHRSMLSTEIHPRSHQNSHQKPKYGALMIAAETEKIEGYIARVMTAVEDAGFYIRDKSHYPFDTIATSMMSKSVALARSCIHLLKSDNADEAFGLGRTLVECALILRFITSDSTLQEERAVKFVEFSFDYKNYWLYHARKQAAGTPWAADIERYATRWKLDGDPKKASKHWSQLRGFTWDAQNMVHPLDDALFDSDFKTKQYAVDYFQACQWVHCSQPGLDNYVPPEGEPFRFSKSVGEFGHPAHSVLYVLLHYLHRVMNYAFYGLGVPRPADLELAYAETLRSMEPLGSF